MTAPRRTRAHTTAQERAAHTDRASLTERYVDAAMRTVPDGQRSDLEEELRASIADQVDALTEGGRAPSDAERTVLAELGDPELLAAGYTDRKLFLIGPRYYLTWWRLVKLLLAIVLPCVAFGVALGATLSGQPVGEIIGSTVATIFSAGIQLVFWTTLVFFVLERSTAATAQAEQPWSPDDLPEPRQQGSTVTDLAVSLGFLVIGIGALIWDQTIGFVWMDGGLSFFSEALWPWWIAAFGAFAIAEGVYSVLLYKRARVTMSLAWANAALAVLFLSAVLTLLGRGLLLNPEFFPTVIQQPDAAATVTAIVTALIVFGSIALTCWDIFDGFRKARRAHA